MAFPDNFNGLEKVMFSCETEPTIGTHIEVVKFTRKRSFVDEVKSHVIRKPLPRQAKRLPIKWKGECYDGTKLL